MELGTPLDIKAVPASDRGAVKDELISLVTRLHERYGIVHGDIHPGQFVRCQDGVLRLIDFDSARWIDEDHSAWEGSLSPRYSAPNRGLPQFLAPKVKDDMYGLALTLWELYTGGVAFLGRDLEEMEEVLEAGRTVDLSLVEDDEARAWIREQLLAGGAKID